MELIHKDFKKGIVKIRVTDLEDLWYLSHLIDPGDFITGKTTRKIKIGVGDNVKVTKKTLTLQVEAETVEFGKNSDKLRVNGKISDGPEDLARGDYHAIALDVGSDFTLQKVQWLTYQKQKLTEAQQEKQTYLLCLADRDECLFALTQKNGYKVLAKLQGDVAKKRATVEVKKDFFEEISQNIQEYNQRHQPLQIILASPAFYKEEILKKVPKELHKKITLATCSSVSQSALDEVMKRPELKTVLKESRQRSEKILMDELLHEIKKDHLASYGWKQVLAAVDAGAVSKLLLTDDLIKKRREDKKYEQLDEAMKHIDTLKGEIHIISSDHDSGKQLDGLGGIAAILRYKLH
jgi:protein pelota